MQIVCEIVLEYDEESASAIYRAVIQENDGYVESKIEGGKITFTASSDSAMSLYHTINDLMSCIKAAESSILRGAYSS